MKNLFKNKKVTVMGIGLHGGAVETIKWLSEQGAHVIATDKKNEKELQNSLRKIKQIKNIKVVTGQHRMEDFESVDLVVKNPAVPWNNKYVQAALEKKIPVEMDSSLFFKYCISKNIIGITGTKGKTTVSLLLAHIMEKSGLKVVRVGIGQEPVLNKIGRIESEDDWVVFELSSWRLSALKNIAQSPQIALVTNIFPDHLNYYSSMEEYIEDKKNICKYQKSDDFLLLNKDNQYSEEFESDAKGKLGFFSFDKSDKNICVYVEQDEIRFNLDGDLGSICDVREVPLRGSHNLRNALAACLVALIIGISPKQIKLALKTFSSIPHRLELIATIGKVSYYNDSAATTPEAAIAAINSFTNQIILICGGADKNLQLANFAKKVSSDKKVAKVILLKGSATAKFEKLIKEEGGWHKVVGSFDNFPAAIEAARQNASENSLVLLSPGCASFGMFVNEFDRGDQFREIVRSMKNS